MAAIYYRVLSPYISSLLNENNTLDVTCSLFVVSSIIELTHKNILTLNGHTQTV